MFRVLFTTSRQKRRTITRSILGGRMVFPSRSQDDLSEAPLHETGHLYTTLKACHTQSPGMKASRVLALKRFSSLKEEKNMYLTTHCPPLNIKCLSHGKYSVTDGHSHYDHSYGKMKALKKEACIDEW